MSPDEWRFRIEDILNSIQAIREYTKGMKFEEFVSDRKTVDAVIRNLIVIGEASARIPGSVRQNHPKIPWIDMSDIRNFVVHEYFRVSDKIVWETVKNDLPLLVKPLQDLIPQ
ncbi:MAG: DUF86 domain-containing protein [Desulfobacterales bacterium]|nr:DUF86 domain-containing protein [Desulfobacterales bacterium]